MGPGLLWGLGESGDPPEDGPAANMSPPWTLLGIEISLAPTPNPN